MTQDQFKYLCNIIQSIDSALKSYNAALILVSKNKTRNMERQILLIEEERGRIKHFLDELATTIE